MDLLGFDLNLADMDERFPILVQYGIYNRDLMPYKSDDFNHGRYGRILFRLRDP